MTTCKHTKGPEGYVARLEWLEKMSKRYRQIGDYPMTPSKPNKAILKAGREMMFADALALIEFLQKNKAKYDILSAMFNSRGQRIDGSDKIEVEIIKHTDHIWFYRVKPIQDYVFVIMPVVSCYIDYGKSSESRGNPTSELFRLVANPLSYFAAEPVTNLRANFSVIGYKPKQLLDKLES